MKARQSRSNGRDSAAPNDRRNEPDGGRLDRPVAPPRTGTRHVNLSYLPRRWQELCHKSVKRFTVLALHRRAGKTELAIMQLIDRALKFDKDLGAFFYVAPFLKQAKAIAWARLKQKVQPLVLVDAVAINEAELSVFFKHNGASIRIFGADNPDAMRGVRLDGVVVDEVAQIKPEVWFDILQPALSDRLGWSLFIGTPSGVNLFSELFFGAKDKPDWHASVYTVYDTNAILPSEVERLKQSMPETSFAREYLCDWSASGEDQLISLSDVLEATRRFYKEFDISQSPKILGVDPARFGDDRAVIVQRQGLQMFPPTVLRGVDNMSLASRVANMIEDWGPDAVFVDQGAGSGVIDRLRQLGYDVMEVPFGGKATQPHLFANRRSEMWSQMAEWIRSGGAIPADNELGQELATPIYWFDATGRKVLESKDDIKKRLQGGASPDIADALALTFAAPVKKRLIMDEIERVFKKKTEKQEYDPYAKLFEAR